MERVDVIANCNWAAFVRNKWVCNMYGDIINLHVCHVFNLCSDSGPFREELVSTVFRGL